MGHKWMWNAKWGGLPSQEFLTSVDPLFAGIREKLGDRYETSDRVAGTLCAGWAKRLGLSAGIPIPVGALDAHWDAIAANIRLGDVVNVIGTSTCIIGISEQQTLVPGVCGIVPGSVIPGYVGIEAGLSAVGDLFDGIARRAASDVATLSKGLHSHRAGQTGLLRLTWDNGDRTVLVNPNLGGVTLGWKVMHTAQDELFAAIEGTALHTRIILERMEERGAPVNRIINGGGIPQKNEVLNRVYANALNKPLLVPSGDVLVSAPRYSPSWLVVTMRLSKKHKMHYALSIGHSYRITAKRQFTTNCIRFTARCIFRSDCPMRRRHKSDTYCQPCVI